MRTPQMFWKWIEADARWYQFWMPNSGWGGGLVAGVTVMTVLNLVSVMTEMLL